MSLRAWIATRFSMLLLGAMMVFVFALFVARQVGANGEARAIAEERARLAQLILRQTGVAGTPIIVRERRSDSLPLLGASRLVLEPRLRELLNVVGGYIWVLSDTVLYSSGQARLLDSAAINSVNTSLKQMRDESASSREVALGRQGILLRQGVMVERQETLPNGQVLRVVAAAPLAEVSLSPL
jgi:hypothetical protein